IRETVEKALTLKEAYTMNACLAYSKEFWAGFVDGELACVWGLAPPTLLSDNAYLWLYVTDQVRDHEFLFIRHSQLAVKEMLKTYETLVGVTKKNNTKAIRWLKWLGAEFEYSTGDIVSFTIRKNHG